uniref:UNC93-like protein n=1 Tax=Macrostomum lignano TaxID=282301 RepID=A0A1I8FER2_9PLAT
MANCTKYSINSRPRSRGYLDSESFDKQTFICSCMEATEKASLETDEQPAMSRGRSVKNLLAGLSAIQSSFNSSGGLGVAGLAVTYASVVASSLALAPLVIGRLGPKRTMAACLCAYLLYLAANLYPHWGTIIPASVLLGVSSAPLWAAMSVYVVRLAGEYARAGGHDGGGDGTEGRQRSAVSVFFGSSSRCLPAPTSGATSSLTWRSATGSSTPPALWALQSATSAAATASAQRATPTGMEAASRDRRSTSGAAPRDAGAAARQHPSDAAPHGGLAAAAACSCLTVNVGLSQSFIVSDFTEGFVACSSGIGAVGRVMMCYGAGHVLGVLFGLVAGRLGKLPPGAAQIGLEVAGLLWQVEAEPVAYFYCYAFAWGCVDTVWNSQMNERTRRFSAYRFFESLGYILGLLLQQAAVHQPEAGRHAGRAVSAGCLMLVASAAVDRRARGGCGRSVAVGSEELRAEVLVVSENVGRSRVWAEGMHRSPLALASAVACSLSSSTVVVAAQGQRASGPDDVASQSKSPPAQQVQKAASGAP